MQAINIAQFNLQANLLCTLAGPTEGHILAGFFHLLKSALEYHGDSSFKWLLKKKGVPEGFDARAVLCLRK